MNVVVGAGRLIAIIREVEQTIRTSWMYAGIVTLSAAMMEIFTPLASSPESVDRLMAGAFGRCEV